MVSDKKVLAPIPIPKDDQAFSSRYRNLVLVSHLWLGISIQLWGIEKVNWKLLESLIDEYNDQKMRSTVEVHRKKFVHALTSDIWKKNQRKSLLTTSTYLQKQIITNFTAMNRKGFFFKWVKARSKIIGLKTFMKEILKIGQLRLI